MTQAFVINLDRSVERWAAFEKTNQAHLPYERFSAIEGSLLSRVDLQAQGILNANVEYTTGAVGCAASHIALWKKAVAENRNLTICEDDAVFNAAFVARSEILLKQLEGKFDLILWGWNFDSTMSYQMLPGVSICAARFDQGRMRQSIAAFQRLNFVPSLYRLTRAFGLPSYTISAQGAEALLKNCLPLRNMSVRFPGYDYEFPNNGIDIVTSAFYPSLRAYVSLPPLVITPNLRPISTVQIDDATTHDLVSIED